jgi:parallel beta-helix repeat protein
LAQAITGCSEKISATAFPHADWQLTAASLIARRNFQSSLIGGWANRTRTTINCGTGGGDGIYCDTASSPTITDCTITGEGDWENSYGIVCFNSSAPTVTNCAISGCNYNIWCNTGSSPTVRNCTLSGGYNGFACRESSPIVVNCVISGNEQGVYFDSGSPTFTNDTIVFNSAEGINGYVAATPTITNCIVWNPDATAELIECTATYSDIRGGAVGTGNINADPNFTSAHTGDFRLNAGSPCIDAATSVGAPATDREGTPRPQGGGFDMGAYENHPATCLLQYASADANGSIIGVATQVVSFNGSGTSVTASPATGYHFVEWSDHSTANPRTDVNVTADADYTATFAINTYTLSYAAGTGGSLEGSATQVLVHGSSTTAVTAVPNEGYVFVRWSDGVTTAERTDVNVTANLNVTANFAATTTLVLSTKSKSGIAYGTKVSLAGTLKAGLAPVAGRQVIVRTSTNGTTFTDSSLRPTTIATGAFSVAASPSTKTWYCVRFAGDSGYLSYGPTAAIYLTPKAYVGNPVAPSTMSKTSYYSVYAYLKPRHSAGTNPVRIYRYRYVSGSWRQYGTYVTAKAANYSTYSKCSVKMKLPYTGKWRLRAYHSDAGHSTAWSSGYDYVTVK